MWGTVTRERQDRKRKSGIKIGDNGYTVSTKHRFAKGEGCAKREQILNINGGEQTGAGTIVGDREKKNAIGFTRNGKREGKELLETTASSNRWKQGGKQNKF